MILQVLHIGPGGFFGLVVNLLYNIIILLHYNIMKTRKDTILMICSIILYLGGAGIVEALILIESEKTRRILGVAIDCINLLSNVLMGFYRNNNKVNEINTSQTNHSLNNILSNTNLCSRLSTPNLSPPLSPQVIDNFINIPTFEDIHPKTPRNSKIFITSDLTPSQVEYLKSH